MPELTPPYTEIQFTLPFSLQFDGEFAFPWQGRALWVRVENIPMWDRRSKEVTGLEPLGNATITIPGSSGLSHVAKVDVRYPGLPTPTGATIEGMQHQREQACAAVNRLIDVYSLATSDFRVRRVMPDHDVWSISSFVVTEEGRSLDGSLVGGLRPPAYPVRIRDLSDENSRKAMEAILLTGEPIPASREYLQEARRFFHEREFRLAVILASTALEVQWAELLDAGMEKQGVPRTERRKRLRSYTTPTSNKGTLARLDLGLTEIFHRSVQMERPELWQEINGRARELRKNVIHPEVKLPQQEETLASLVAIEQSMRWLRSEIIPLILGEEEQGAPQG